MNQSKIEVTCNRCNFHKFYVIEPIFDYPKNGLYYSCPKCIREFNRERPRMEKFERFDDYEKCKKCVESDHEGYMKAFCRCEERNIRIAKEQRKRNESAWSTP